MNDRKAVHLRGSKKGARASQSHSVIKNGSNYKLLLHKSHTDKMRNGNETKAFNLVITFTNRSKRPNFFIDYTRGQSV